MGVVLSIGNLNFDLYVRVPELPGPDESIETIDVYTGGGGSAANFAVAMARLGVKSRFLGVVGNDVFGDMLLEELKGENVDVKFVKRANRNTGFVIVLIDSNGCKRMVKSPGANEELGPDMIREDVLRDVIHIHVATKREDIIGRIASIRIYASKSLMLLTELAKRGIDIVRKVAYGFDYVFLNRAEAMRLLGGSREGLAVELGSLLGVKEIIVTLGEDGVEAWREGEYERFSAFKVPLVDPTGAGDTFAAAYIFASLLGFDISTKLIFASAAAALKVMRRGARASPRLDEILEFLMRRGYSSIARSVMDRVTTLD